MVIKEEDYLNHVGVLGMQWGKHKVRETAYRKQMAAISRNKNASKSDRKRAKYRNQPLSIRLGKAAAGAVAVTIIKDILLSKTGGGVNIKQGLAQYGNIAFNTAKTIALKDAYARSASTKYEKSGKQKIGVKKRLVTREDLLDSGVNVARVAIPIAKYMIGTKAMKARIERSRNEDMYTKMRDKGHLLSEKLADSVWLSKTEYSVA